jgi:hypothetical protein
MLPLSNSERAGELLMVELLPKLQTAPLKVTI